MEYVFKTPIEIVSTFGPIVCSFYLVAFGIIFFRKKIKKEYFERNSQLIKQTAELELEKEYTRNLLRSSLDAIIAVDEFGKITEISERVCELLGYKKEDIENQKVKKFYASGEGSRVMNALRNSGDGTIENFNTYILGKSGERIPISLSAAFLYDRENLILEEELSKKRKFRSIGYFRDIRPEKAIDDIAKGITSTTDEKELFDVIAENVANIIKAEACSLLTYNESRGMLKVIASFGVPEPLKKNEWLEWYGKNETLIAKIFSSKQTLNILNIDVRKKIPKDQYFNWKNAENFAKYSRFNDFKHFLGTPLIVKGEVYGVIRALNKYTTDSKLDKEGFTDNDQKLLERISNQVSILIEKVRDKARFEAISKVGCELNEMLDIPRDELLEIIVKEVVKGMQFKACYLRLIEGVDNLKINACYGLKEKFKRKDKYILKIGEGISGNVVKTSQYCAVTDLSKEKKYAFSEIWKEEGLRSMLSIPLKYRNRVMGVINCYSRRVHNFTDQEIQIMETFASYASIAIQNKKRVDELMELNKLGSELVKPVQIEELFDLLLKRAKALSGADRTCIKIYDEQHKEMKTVSALDCKWYEKNKNVAVNFWKDKINKVLKEGRSKIISSSNEMQERCKSLPDSDLLSDIKQTALVPIKTDDKVFGIIFLDSYIDNYFTEDDLLVLEAFSSQAAIALRNAILFDKLHKVTETFPQLSEVDTNMESVLQNIADIAAKVLETDILLIYRWDNKDEKIIWPPVFSGNSKYEDYMMSEEDSSDIPMEFITKEKSHYAENAETDEIMIAKGKPAKNGAPGGRFVFREGIVSSAGIILKVGQKKVGVMFINYRTHHKFDQDERKIIENYASYIAIAIQNVKYFSEKHTAAAMQTLGQLAAVIAHNMKNDISTINLYAGDLIDETEPGNSDYESLSRIKEKIRKITSDIDNLLAASGEKIIKKEAVDTKSLINSLEKEISSDLEAKNIELKKKIARNALKIKIDPAQIKMVLSNLAYNSMESMLNGGRITISVSKSGNDVLLDWKDTGKGIPPEHANDIFQPFWTTKGKGFGLGLFLSRAIIEGHGGSIAVNVKYKRGANFIIRLPIRN
jgi:PAS domain S-box-containing protein